MSPFRKSTTLLLIVVLALMLESWFYQPRRLDYGVTFSQKFAEELDLYWRTAYLAILDELKVKDLRLIAYWDKVEPEEGKFNFEDLDWQVTEAEKRGAEIVLVVGRKAPRWPECHTPHYVREFSIFNSKFSNRLLNYIKATVERYAKNNAVIAWQVENEPLFPFGECDVTPSWLLNKEIDLVRSLDDRPIILTDSGEMGFAWPYLTIKADAFGTTLYRYVSNERLGDIKYWFIPPAYFRLKAAWTKLWRRDYLISELQAEPWSTKSLSRTPLEDQYKTMNPGIFKEIINYAERSGFPKAYFWGAEWWYWMKEKHNRPEMWDNVKALFNANQPI